MAVVGGFAADAAVITLLCMISLGSRFSDELPDSLPDEFVAVLTRNHSSERLLLDSAYSWPNLLLPLLGGVLIDKILGLRGGIILSCIVVALGSSLVAMAGSIKALAGSDLAFGLALAGWVLFSFGEIMYIGQQGLAAKRFGGRCFATVLGITNCFGQLCTAVNFATMPKVSQRLGFASALWCATTLCYISVVAAFVLANLSFANGSGFSDTTRVLRGSGGNSGEADEEFLRIREGEESDDINGLRERLLGIDEGSRRGRNDGLVSAVNDVVCRVFSAREWLLVLVCVCMYISLSQFFSIGCKLFEHVYGLSEVDAAFYISLPYTVEAFALPFVAYCVDYFGYPLRWLFFSTIMITLVHLLFVVCEDPPRPKTIVSLFALGRTCLSASFWPMVAYLLPPELVGTGYGLMISFQNVGLALAPIVVGQMLPNYHQIELMLAMCGALATVACAAASAVDVSQNGTLQGRPRYGARASVPSQ